MQIFASITYYFLLYTEQCEQWFNIIQIDTNKKEKRKDTQYYCDKEIFNSFLPPNPLYSVSFDHLPVNQWIPRLELTECLFERRENISQVLMIRDSSVWGE